jgi:hypothetical protein
MAQVIPSVYRHTQSVAAATWTITHNLGGASSQAIPIVDAFIMDNGVLSKIIPGSVTIADKNTVILQFSMARSGEAIVIA